ncbi:hypothetical protein I5535_12905 [Rhodobacteraceae bacterium F11138]|nr:hypothetical protein [Rhodobacteraceae bacterium F11138]
MFRTLLISAALVVGVAETSRDAQAQDALSTVVHGTLFVRDIDGQTTPVPWTEDILKRAVVFQGRPFSTPEQRVLWNRTVNDIDVPQDDPKFVVYEVKLVKSDKIRPAEVYLHFAHDGYYLHEKVHEFVDHVGSFEVGPLYIQREQRNNGERMAVVHDFLEQDSFTQSDLSRSLLVLESLMAEVTDREVFFLLVAMVRKLMTEQGYIDQQMTRVVMDLPSTLTMGALGKTTFRDLPKAEQFQILSGLAFWFARAPELAQQIPPNLTYYQVAQTLFYEAANIAEYHEDEIEPSDLATTFQNYYAMECKNGTPIDCFEVIERFSDLELQSSKRTYKAFLGAYVGKLEEASGLGRAGDVSDDAFHRRVASDPDLLFYWENFLLLSETEKLAPIVRSSAYLKKAKSWAQKIQAHAQNA